MGAEAPLGRDCGRLIDPEALNELEVGARRGSYGEGDKGVDGDVYVDVNVT